MERGWLVLFEWLGIGRGLLCGERRPGPACEMGEVRGWLERGVARGREVVVGG